MYKTKYSYLNLGVVGAIIELEFCRKLKEIWQPNLKYYHLGELVLDCPKVNYKLNYQPGQILCPYSKEWVDYSVVKDHLLAIGKLTKEEKQKYQVEEKVESKPPVDGDAQIFSNIDQDD